MPDEEKPKYRYSYGDTIITAGIIALINSLQSQTNKQRTDNNNHDANEQALVRYTRRLTAATWVIAIAAILSFFAALLQWGALRSTDYATHKAADAAERSSTAGRAYLFIKYETPQAPEMRFSNEQDRSRFRVSIRFSIKNYGPTPAIISKIETHLLVRGDSFFNPHDPTAPEALPAYENSRGWITTSKPVGGIIATKDNGNVDPVIIQGSEDTGTLTQDFSFREREAPKGSIVSPAWFYCAITYKDIFGITERHTYYYVGLFGAGISYPENPNYNRWD